MQLMRDDSLSVLAILHMVRHGAGFHVLRYKPTDATEQKIKSRSQYDFNGYLLLDVELNRVFSLKIPMTTLST